MGDEGGFIDDGRRLQFNLRWDIVFLGAIVLRRIIVDLDVVPLYPCAHRVFLMQSALANCTPSVGRLRGQFVREGNLRGRICVQNWLSGSQKACNSQGSAICESAINES
jgi:hypothetical protein